MTASQACADVMPNPAWLSSKAAASMLAIVHPWRKAARVGDLKAGPQASFGRLVPGPLDGAPGDVDAHCVGAVRGGQQSLLPRAAAGIKHPPGQQALLSKPYESRLRPADVPRRRRARHVRLVPARHGHGVLK